MKVKCVDNAFCSTLSIDKEYTVIDEGDKFYVILDNLQNEITCKKERFLVIEDGDLTKKTKATINELNYQLQSDFKDVKDFTIRKNSRDEIKQIIIKFKY